jgi:hypothetical protein
MTFALWILVMIGWVVAGVLLAILTPLNDICKELRRMNELKEQKLNLLRNAPTADEKDIMKGLKF